MGEISTIIMIISDHKLFSVNPLTDLITSGFEGIKIVVGCEYAYCQSRFDLLYLLVVLSMLMIQVTSLSTNQ